MADAHRAMMLPMRVRCAASVGAALFLGCSGRDIGNADAEAGGDESGTEASTEDDSVSGADDGADATTEGDAACGNGSIDPGEACDDGNDVDGDGCNRDCVESGTLLWSVDLVFDDCVDLSTDIDGSIYVAGDGVDPDIQSALIARIDPADGAQIWEAAYEPPSGDGYAGRIFGLADRPGFVFGGSFVDDAVFGPWSQSRDEQGTLVTEFIDVDPEAPSLTHVLLADRSDAVWWRIETTGADPARLELWRVSGGAIDWKVELGTLDDASPPPSYLAGAAISGGGAVLVADSPTSSLARYDEAGDLTWSLEIDASMSTHPDDVAVGPDGTIHVALAVDAESSDPKVLVRHYTPDGALVGEFAHGDATADSTHEWDGRLVVDSAGSVLVVASEVRMQGEDEYRVRLAKYASDGTPFWTRLFPDEGTSAASDAATPCAIAVADDDAVAVAVALRDLGATVTTLHRLEP